MKRAWIGAAAGAAVLLGGAMGFAHAVYAQMAPPQVSFSAQSDAVPFELFRGNRIVVPARINGRAAQVILDTGASATTLDRSYARSIGLPEGRKITGRGAGGTVEAELVSDVTIEIGGMRLDKMTVGVIDLAAVSRPLGRPLTIILGRDFFDSAVVSIDWASKTLRIQRPQQFAAARGAVPLTLTRKGAFNTIAVSVAGQQPIEALLDLGNGGTLILPRSYWGERAELNRLRSAETRVGGVGGMHSARAVIMPRLGLAGRSFANVPVVLSDIHGDGDATQMANVGIGLLKQFKVDFDLGRNRIYLTPRTDAPPFERERAGARFDLVGDRLKVGFVSPGGPAAAAGLREGDEIVAVDGRAVTRDYFSAPDWTRGTAGKAVALDRPDGSKVTITLSDYY